MKNRITAFLLFILVIFSLTAYADTAMYQSEEDQKKIDFVTAIGIIEKNSDGEIMPDSFITRLEMAKILVRMWDFSTLSTGDNTFSDTQMLTNDEKGYVNTVSSLGFMVGLSDGSFGCDKYLTYNQLLKILVCALGYRLKAENSGGYPSGYFSVAHQIGVTDGINGYSPDDEITMGHVAVLVYNALHIPVNYYNVSSNGSVSLYQGATLLEERHNIYKGAGYVESIDGMSVTNDAPVSGKSIRINGKEYYKGNTDTRNLIGRKIEFYYWYSSPSHDDYTLVYIDKDNENFICISAENIAYYSDYRYAYYISEDKDKTKDLNFSKATDVIYNYRVVESPDEKLFNSVSCGEICGYDSNNDKIMDIIYINSYETFLISRINKETKTIYDKYDNKKSLCLDNEKYNISMYNMNNEDVIFEELNVGDVLSVAVSLDGEYIYGIVSYKYIEGTIEELRNANKIVINSDEYLVEKDFSLFSDEYKLGMTGKFYLNYSGQICGSDVFTSDELKYGYLVDTLTENSLENSVKYLIYTDNGEFEEYFLEDKIEYNYNNVSERINLFTGNIINSKLDLVPQLIRYKLNSQGKISKLSVAISYSADTLASDYLTGFRQMIYRAPGDSQPYFKTSGYQAGGRAVFEEDALLFVIPKNLENKDEFAVGKISSLIANLEYDVIPYTSHNNSEKSEAGVLLNSDLIVRTVSAGLSSSQMLVVSNITKVVNDKGEVVKKLEAYRNGEFVSYLTRTEDALGNADVGDTIQVGLFDSKEVNDIYVVYDCSKDFFNHTQNPYRYSQTTIYDSYIRVGKGYAYSNDGELLRVYYGDKDNIGNAKFTELDLINASVYKIAVVEDGKVRKGTVNDIYSYINDVNPSEIVVSTHSGNPGTIVVYN